MDTRDKFSVAIVGGGIGGLALAVALAKTGAAFQVDIYESTVSFGEIGAGIGLWPRVWDTMKILGLEEDLKSSSTNLGEDGRMIYHKCDQADSEPVFCGQAKQSMKTFHRAEFLKILEKHIPLKFRTHFSKRLVSYDDSAPSPITLYFTDGTTAECDILIGADGLRSAVRRTLFTGLATKALDQSQAAAYQRCVEATWSGVVTYRALVPAEAFKAEYPDHPAVLSPICYFGKGKAVISYPVSQGRMINTVVLVYKQGQRGTTYEGPWVTQADEGEIAAQFAEWNPQVLGLIKVMKGSFKWAVHEVRELPTFASGRVALLGDAAHAMTPHLASGAGQAVEDGLILASLLAQQETQKDTIQYALEVYSEVRRPFTKHIQDLSFQLGEIVWLESPRMRHYTADDSAAGKIPQSELDALVADDSTNLQKWAWTTTSAEDGELAIQKIKAKASGHASTAAMHVR
ncbi:hypothetical protein BC835DRAFT_1414956 [Cytidiella melzeri]|nr:hypothetical protein BC835DRAFT_1414956 [Cytidiella melzeri]